MKPSFVLTVLVLTLACTDRSSPVAPTAVADPAPPLTPPSLPTNVPGVLRLSLPGESLQFAQTGFGIKPFGYHGDDHAADGHAGWDFAFALAGVARAAAAGTVEAVVPDSNDPALM